MGMSKHRPGGWHMMARDWRRGSLLFTVSLRRLRGSSSTNPLLNHYFIGNLILVSMNEKVGILTANPLPTIPHLDLTTKIQCINWTVSKMDFSYTSSITMNILLVGLTFYCD